MALEAPPERGALWLDNWVLSATIASVYTQHVNYPATHILNPHRSDTFQSVDVAQLAGLPESALARAREILRTLETKGDIRVDSKDENQTPLLPIFSGHPVLDELKMCDTDNLTPMQALAAVADWKKRLKD